jgi:hypothetical protein
MTEDHRVALVLSVDPDCDPIRGVLTAEDGLAREFVGWLGLATEIERTLRARAGGAYCAGMTVA